MGVGVGVGVGIGGETVGETSGGLGVGESVGESGGESVGEANGGEGEVGKTVGEAREGETVGVIVGEANGGEGEVGKIVGETGLAGSGERVGSVGSVIGGVCSSPKSQSSEQTFGYSSHNRVRVVSITASPSAPSSQRLMPPILAPPSNRPVPTINETISVSTPEPPQGCCINFSPGERKLGSARLYPRCQPSLSQQKLQKRFLTGNDIRFCFHSGLKLALTIVARKCGSCWMKRDFKIGAAC